MVRKVGGPLLLDRFLKFELSERALGTTMIELDGFFQVFLGGMLGQLLLELVKIASWSDGAVVASKYRQVTYWIGIGALFLVSGIVTVLNGTHDVPLVRAAVLGISAPATVAAWAGGRTNRRRPPRGRASFAPPDVGGQEQQRSNAIDKVASLYAW